MASVYREKEAVGGKKERALFLMRIKGGSLLQK